jgi:hypothetical protein
MNRERFFPAHDRRPIHLGFGSAFVALLLACGAQTAGAQTAPLPQATLQQLGAPSAPAGYCKQSSLTGPAFLNAFDTIIEHGDLTDIAFLQKTLRTKLSPLAGFGTPDLDDLVYESDQVLGSPLPVQVTVFKRKEIQTEGGVIAEVQLKPILLAQVYAMNCLVLTPSDFVSLFGQLNAVWTGGTLPGGVGFIKLKAPGKNGTKLEVSFGYNCYLPGRCTLQQDLVSDVSVKESQ